MQKKLFLTSSTITPNLVNEFEKLIGKNIQNLKCTFIPDAAYGVVPLNDLVWVQEEREYLVQMYNWEVNDLVLKDTEEVTIEDFENTDLVFVNGGFSGYLANEMRRTKFDQILPKLFEKNIVYVGSSAGSMVCSGYQLAAEIYIGEPEENADQIRGLDLVDFELYPHYREELLPELKDLYKGDKLYLIKDGEAIVGKGGEVHIAGKERFL